MLPHVPMPESSFRVNLNNAVFGLICADAELRARYKSAGSVEAQEICSDQFDPLAANAGQFIERFIVIER